MRMDSSMPCGVNLARERETEGIAVLYVRPLQTQLRTSIFLALLLFLLLMLTL